jgi:hypothetical protein
LTANFLLTLASKVILGSKSREIHDRILLSAEQLPSLLAPLFRTSALMSQYIERV